MILTQTLEIQKYKTVIKSINTSLFKLSINPAEDENVMVEYLVVVHSLYIMMNQFDNELKANQFSPTKH